jgi:hypothetical protein
MDNDTHDQWRAFNHPVDTVTNALEQILANHPGINARQLFFRAVAKGLIESSATIPAQFLGAACYEIRGGVRL